MSESWTGVMIGAGQKYHEIGKYDHLSFLSDTGFLKTFLIDPMNLISFHKQQQINNID